MRSKTMMKYFVAGAFVVGFGLGWAVKGDNGAVAAQAPHAPFMMQRIYSGTDGLSHVENIELNTRHSCKGSAPRPRAISRRPQGV